MAVATGRTVIADIIHFQVARSHTCATNCCRVIECKGPTNGRTYTVAVYFKGKRLAAAHGHNIQEAEMNAATKALEHSKGNNFENARTRRNVLAVEINVFAAFLECPGFVRGFWDLRKGGGLGVDFCVGFRRQVLKGSL